MEIKRVGIIRGGEGEHYMSSLLRGGDLISYVLHDLSDKYKIIDILIDKKGVWHAGGVPISPADLIRKIDVVWNMSRHPNISVILDDLAIPNIDASLFSKALLNNNEMLRTHIKSIGLQMPRSIVFPLYQEDFDGPKEKYAILKAKEVLHKFSAPWIVKSFTPDSNMGIHLAKTFGELVDAIEDGVIHKKSILVEEFISGKIVSIHSLSQYRGENIYVFPLDNSFNVFSPIEKEKLTNLTKDLYQHINAKHYLKSDFVFHPRNGIFLTGIDLLPDFRKGSHFEKSCESVGAKMRHIFEHISGIALNKKV
jgi:D-alanine-D-alanine ligase-like ATP-grasp enzyme